MKPQIWYDEKIGVVRIKHVGSFTKEELSETFSTPKQLFEGKEHSLLLADISESACILPTNEERKAKEARFFKTEEEALSWLKEKER